MFVNALDAQRKYEQMSSILGAKQVAKQNPRKVQHRYKEINIDTGNMYKSFINAFDRKRQVIPSFKKKRKFTQRRQHVSSPSLLNYHPTIKKQIAIRRQKVNSPSMINFDPELEKKKSETVIKPPPDLIGKPPTLASFDPFWQKINSNQGRSRTKQLSTTKATEIISPQALVIQTKESLPVMPLVKLPAPSISLSSESVSQKNPPHLFPVSPSFLRSVKTLPIAIQAPSFTTVMRIPSQPATLVTEAFPPQLPLSLPPQPSPKPSASPIVTDSLQTKAISTSDGDFDHLYLSQEERFLHKSTDASTYVHSTKDASYDKRGVTNMDDKKSSLQNQTPIKKQTNPVQGNKRIFSLGNHG